MSSPARWACCAANSSSSEETLALKITRGSEPSHLYEKREKNDEYARTTTTEPLVPIANNNLGPAGISHRRGLFPVHRTHSSRPWLLTICLVPLVPIDDALHASWKWWARWIS